MMNYYLTTGLGLMAAVGVLSAVEVGEKPEMPQLPDSKYVVHDGTETPSSFANTRGEARPCKSDRTAD